MKEKKITVKFKSIRSSIYCHITYDRKTTKFVYFKQDKIDELVEVSYVERCVRFLLNRQLYPPYFSKISELINVKFLDGLEILLPIQIYDDLGDILTYNQYDYLTRNAFNNSNYNIICSVFDVNNHSSLKIKSLKLNFENIVKELSNDSKRELFILTVLHHFEKPSSFRLINYLCDPKSMLSKLETFIKENIDNLYKLSFLNADLFEVNIPELAEYFEYLIDEFINDNFV